MDHFAEPSLRYPNVRLPSKTKGPRLSSFAVSRLFFLSFLQNQTLSARFLIQNIPKPTLRNFDWIDMQTKKDPKKGEIHVRTSNGSDIGNSHPRVCDLPFLWPQMGSFDGFPILVFLMNSCLCLNHLKLFQITHYLNYPFEGKIRRVNRERPLFSFCVTSMIISGLSCLFGIFSTLEKCPANKHG